MVKLDHHRRLENRGHVVARASGDQDEKEEEQRRDGFRSFLHLTPGLRSTSLRPVVTDYSDGCTVPPSLTATRSRGHTPKPSPTREPDPPLLPPPRGPIADREIY